MEKTIGENCELLLSKTQQPRIFRQRREASEAVWMGPNTAMDAHWTMCADHWLGVHQMKGTIVTRSLESSAV